MYPLSLVLRLLHSCLSKLFHLLASAAHAQSLKPSQSFLANFIFTWRFSNFLWSHSFLIMCFVVLLLTRFDILISSWHSLYSYIKFIGKLFLKCSILFPYAWQLVYQYFNFIFNFVKVLNIELGVGIGWWLFIDVHIGCLFLSLKNS